MSEFKNKSITTKGMELLSKALSGETLEFTKIELGSGDFTGDIGEVSELVQLKQSLPITKISRKGSQVTLSTTLRIEDIVTSFDWSEIGIYAKGNDGVEILYMYGYTENISYISKDSLNEKLIHVTVMVSNVAEVTAKIDESLVYLTDEALKEHGVDQEAHKDIRAEVKALEGQLSNIDVSWGAITGKPTTFPPQTHTHSYLPNPSAGTVSEMGQYIDFHKSGSNADYDARIYVDNNSRFRVVSSGYDYDINNEIVNLKERINQMSGHYRMSNTIRVGGNNVTLSGTTKLNSFIAAKDGTINARVTAVSGGGNYYVYLSGVGVESNNNNKLLAFGTSGGATKNIFELANLPNGTTLPSGVAPYGRQLTIVNNADGTNITHNISLKVDKGDCLVFMGWGSAGRVIRVDICYDEVN